MCAELVGCEGLGDREGTSGVGGAVDVDSGGAAAGEKGGGCGGERKDVGCVGCETVVSDAIEGGWWGSNVPLSTVWVVRYCFDWCMLVRDHDGKKGPKPHHCHRSICGGFWCCSRRSELFSVEVEAGEGCWWGQAVM